jgi:hypothetical protein
VATTILCLLISACLLFLFLLLWDCARKLFFLSLAGMCFAIAGVFWVLKMLAMAAHWAVTPRSRVGRAGA